jgi:hypothetical protein
VWFYLVLLSPHCNLTLSRTNFYCLEPQGFFKNLCTSSGTSYIEVQLFNLFSILSIAVNLIGKYYVPEKTYELIYNCDLLALRLSGSIAFHVVLLQAIVLILPEHARMHFDLTDRPQYTLGF